MVASPLHFLILVVSGWANRHQVEVIEYLQEENRIPRSKLGNKRLRFTDAERRRLARKARKLRRKTLSALEPILPSFSTGRGLSESLPHVQFWRGTLHAWRRHRWRTPPTNGSDRRDPRSASSTRVSTRRSLYSPKRIRDPWWYPLQLRSSLILRPALPPPVEWGPFPVPAGDCLLPPAGRSLAKFASRTRPRTAGCRRAERPDEGEVSCQSVAGH
jgi:hypothetical protein